MTWLLLLSLTATPAEAIEHLTQAETLVLSGDESGAAEAYRAALAADPQNLDALWGLAALTEKGGDFGAAAEHLRAILALDPNDDQARLALARVSSAAGDHDGARAELAALRERHPQMPEALELSQQLEPTQEHRPFHPFARAGVSAGWDSNVGLGAGTTDDPDGVGAVLTTADLVIGARWTGLPDSSITLLGDLELREPLSNRDAADTFMPTTAGAAAVMARDLGTLRAAVDLRYQELFSGLFEEHVQRLIVPSVWAAWELDAHHRLRLLGAVEVRQLDTIDGRPIGPRVTLRDRMTLGKTTVVAELNSRRTVVTGVDGPTGSRQFSELGALLFAEHRASPAIDVFAVVSVTGRAFDEPPGRDAENGPKETEWNSQVGARWRFGDIELHLEYGLARRLARPAREFSRHQVGLGVRYWYF